MRRVFCRSGLGVLVIGLASIGRNRRLVGSNSRRSAADIGGGWRLVGYGSGWRLAGFGSGRLSLRRARIAVRGLVPLDEILAGHRENDFAGSGYPDRITPAGWRPVSGRFRSRLRI